MRGITRLKCYNLEVMDGLILFALINTAVISFILGIGKIIGWRLIFLVILSLFGGPPPDGFRRAEKADAVSKNDIWIGFTLLLISIVIFMFLL